MDLRGRLALDQMIPLAGLARSILPTKEKVEQSTTAKEADSEVGNHRSMTRYEAGRVRPHVARDNTVEVTPANHQPHDDTALVYTFDVVCDPRNSNWN